MSGLATYSTSGAKAMHEDLVTTHAPLVKRIAYHLMNRLPPSVQVDDLIQAGMIGLLEAAGNYDAGQGASFETYAGIRIRGAMLDEIRRSDWTPRSVHRKARQVAEALDISLEEYHQILADASGARIFSYEELSEFGEVMPGERSGNGAPARNQMNEGPLKGLEHAHFKALPLIEWVV